MTWEKENETYFGDTFNREATLTAYNVASQTTIDALNNLSGVCNDYTLTFSNNDNANYIISSKSYNHIAKIDGSQIEVNNTTLTDSLKKLQEQIDQLKQNLEPKKSVNKLRAQLATLNYKREVE